MQLVIFLSIFSASCMCRKIRCDGKSSMIDRSHNKIYIKHYIDRALEMMKVVGVLYILKSDCLCDKF